MSLFQKSVINKYLKTLDSSEVEKSFLKFKEFYTNQARIENIRLLKEENYQEGFLREMFVQVLGYTINPDENYNLTTEFKNLTDAKKADGAILDDGKAIGVIELKSTKTTSLESITEQAFNYKNHQSNCRYIITSNFEKIRFYIDNATDFEEFNLFTLSENDFKILYLILSKESIFNEIPLKLKQESVLHEENISKQLYQDYSQFKRKIFENLVKNNPQFDKLTLFKKSQKLLDRFLFILFGEDSGLVPPNAVSKIIDQWKALEELDEAVSLYSRFVKFFHHLDVGHKYKTFAIPAYNGGLYRKDEILDNFVIDDDILLNDSLKLSAYDFQTEIDVNILGHIFENSLNEIEELTAELAGKAVDKKKTKRKKEGVYYTPKYITKYIVENTVGELCNQKKKELNLHEIEISIIQNSRTKQGKLNRKAVDLLERLQTYSDYLLSLKILDPACGSGAFLNQALEFLIREHQFVDEYRRQLEKDSLGLFDIKKSILENNIYGVDINEESVEIAKLSLWLRTAERGRKLSDLSKNIKCGNSLIDDPEVAGEKAFKWEEEFPQVFTEKEKEPWHITTATHNSRYSQRMFDHHVKLGEPVWLSKKEEQIVTETIAKIGEDDKLNICAYNICGDHVHILLVCEKEELPKIVQKIKSMTARACNIAMGRTTISSTRELAPLSDHVPGSVPAAGDAPVSDHVPGSIPAAAGEDAALSESPPSSENAPSSETVKGGQGRGATQAHLWTQKFGKKEITSEDQLYNTIKYIRNNRIKHDQPVLDQRLQSLVQEMTCSFEHAFRVEYKGGFDVVIGNPPYVRSRELFSDNEKHYLTTNYETTSYQLDLYKIFIEKSLKIINCTGRVSLITPSVFLSNDFDKKLRKFILDNYSLNHVATTDLDLFQDASVKTVVFVISKKSKNNLVRFFKIQEDCFSENKEIDQSIFIKQDYLINENINSESFEVICKLNNIGRIGDSFNVKNGIKVRKELLFNHSLDENYKPFVLGRNVQNYLISFDNVYIHYLYENEKLFSNQAFRTKDIFEQEKVVVRQILGKRIVTAFDDLNFYTDQTTYLILNDDRNQLLALTAILNSKLMYFYFKNTFSDNKLTFPKIKRSQIVELPYKNNSSFTINRVLLLIDLKKQIQLKKNKFLNRIKDNFNLMKLSKKLNAFHEYNFKMFVQELKKQKVVLSYNEQESLEDYFLERKIEITQLQQKIRQIENEIDQMVYKLYDLSEEEIQIVEKSFEK